MARLCRRLADFQPASSWRRALLAIDDNEFGNLRDPEDMFKLISSSGIRFGLNSDTVVFGKKACLGGLLMTYITSNKVSVLIDDLPERNYLFAAENNLPDASYNYTSNPTLSIDSTKKSKNSDRLNTKACNGCLIY